MSKQFCQHHKRELLMGAIVGIVGRPSNSEVISKMLSSQKHRGGDNFYIINQDLINLGMNNSHLKYPQSNNGKNTTISILDGIIAEIGKQADQLTLIGNPVADKSPAAILSHLFDQHELNTFSKLEGEFSSAIWSAKQKQLILMRDRFGHKPLFYSFSDGTLIFSSEIKGILETGFNRSIDLASISDFITLGLFPSSRTPFKNIYKLQAGHLLIFSPGKEPVIKKWFDKKIVENHDIDLVETISKFEEKLCKAISRRAPDKEVHSFLSGGIDSSTLVGFLTKLDKMVFTYALGFKETEFNELDDARLIANHFKTNHTETFLSNKEFFNSIIKVLHHYDEPFSDTSAFPTYFCAKQVRGHTDRIITGDGPDQLYAGSVCYENLYGLKPLNKILFKTALEKFINFSLQNLDLKPDSSLIGLIYRKLFFLSRSYLDRSTDFLMYLPLKKYLCTKDFMQYHYKYPPFRDTLPNTGNIIKDVIEWQCNHMVPDDLMTKVDRCTMAHGLETISPFQDGELFQLTHNLPDDFFVRKEDGKVITKYLLKSVAKRILPQKSIDKPKKGFAMPLDTWLIEQGGEMLRDIILTPRAIQRGYFHKERLTNLIESFLNKKCDWFYGNATTIFGILILELWNREYIDN
jgi:asparagine synthase (glutamine-hydrolysing)